MRETSTDYRHPPRPRPVAWLNALGRTVQRAGIRPGSLDVDRLQRAARRRCKLADPPPFDENLTHCFERLARAIDDEARLHPLGRLMARENLVRILTNRLRFDAHWRAHPEIARIPLAAPVVVVGLQRTGTTLLHRLLSRDPANRWLASWEAVNLAPPPGASTPVGRFRARRERRQARPEAESQKSDRALHGDLRQCLPIQTGAVIHGEIRGRVLQCLCPS